MNLQTFLARTSESRVVRENNVAALLANQPLVGKQSHRMEVAIDNAIGATSFVLPRHFGRCFSGFSSGFRVHSLIPVIWWQRYSPNVSRLIEFDPAVQRVLRVDVNYASGNTLICQVDVNRDSHSGAQHNPACDQCSLKIDDDGFAIAGPSLTDTFDGNYYLQWNPSASSVFTEGR
jgi:hypothetical protein